MHDGVRGTFDRNGREIPKGYEVLAGSAMLKTTCTIKLQGHIPYPTLIPINGIWTILYTLFQDVWSLR